MSSILEIEARSRSEALQKASQILNKKKKKIELEHIGGFLGGILSRKPSIYKVIYKPDLPDFIVVRGITFTVFSKLGIDVEIDFFKDTPEHYYVSIKSEDGQFILGKEGKNLDAFQFLINLILNKITGKNKRVLLDTMRYREKRKNYLQKLARHLANKVSVSGKSFLMNPLNPYERRIIHLELEKDKRVTTESEGGGLYKRVRIIKIDSNEYKKIYKDTYNEE